MHRLEHRAIVADVRARHHPEPAHEARAEVAQHVAVEVLQEQDVEAGGILHEPHAPGVDDHLLVVDRRELLVVHLAGAADEHPVGELHDVGLVEHRHLLAAALLRVAERPAGDARAGLLGGDLGGGHHPGGQRGFDARVEAFGVLADDDQVHAGVAGGHALQVAHRTHRRVEVELLAQAHVDGDEALADRRGAGPLQGQVQAGDGVERLLREHVLATLEGREAGAALHPLDGGARRVEDAADRRGDLGSDPVAGDQHGLMRGHAVIIPPG